MPRDKNIFTLNPTSLDMKRSIFPRNSQHKTSFDLGELVPIYFDEILPGDTVTLDFASVIRMMTPIAPIMDNIYADVYFFYVPNRIIYSNWQQLNGENETGAWTNTSTHRVPVQDIGSAAFYCDMGSIGDYLGLPVIQYGLSDPEDSSSVVSLNVPSKLEVSELPLRAYYSVYNSWFRDENSIAPTIFTIGDLGNGNIKYSDKCKKVARFHDLFSSCLPAPQKGASVSVPIAQDVPVVAEYSFKSGYSPLSSTKVFLSQNVNTVDSSLLVDPAKDKFNINYFDGGDSLSINTGGVSRGSAQLIAKLSEASAATINQLRTAFQVQRLLEKDARGGTRYIELLRAHFGVTSPDARLQRPEYIAGQRFRINVDQIVATADSGDSGSSILGQTGAMSKTAIGKSMFTKSFVEHGILMGFVCIRQEHTYSQGLEKYWLKRDRFDFYYPVLANIGEVPVYKSELCMSASHAPGEDSGVFGYQEAWYEYRFKPSRCSSMMNPALFGSLNYWTLGDVYGPSNPPSLNANFIQETKSFLHRALIYSDQPDDSESLNEYITNQFIADFYFKAKFSRVMPLYSIPGLIDHH